MDCAGSSKFISSYSFYSLPRPYYAILKHIIFKAMWNNIHIEWMNERIKDSQTGKAGTLADRQKAIEQESNKCSWGLQRHINQCPIEYISIIYYIFWLIYSLMLLKMLHVLMSLNHGGRQWRQQTTLASVRCLTKMYTKINIYVCVWVR